MLDHIIIFISILIMKVHPAVVVVDTMDIQKLDPTSVHGEICIHLTLPSLKWMMTLLPHGTRILQVGQDIPHHPQYRLAYTIPVVVQKKLTLIMILPMDATGTATAHTGA